MLNNKILLSLVLLFAPQTFAHSFSEIAAPQEGLTVDLGISSSYRSEALTTSDKPYLISGMLMGGEALPSAKGISLDEAFLTSAFRKKDIYGYLKVGRHLASDEFEMDHVLLGYRLGESAALEIGEMPAAFSPFNGQHALDTQYSSRRLIYDAFWGGQYSEQGLRFKSHAFGFDSGIEIWKGRSFPAKQVDTDRSAFDVYSRYSWKSEQSFLKIGAFYYAADANKRSDDRYDAGHSHGQSITLDPTYFDGNVRVSAATLISRFTFQSGVELGFQGELSRLEQDGRLWDLTREARFDNKTIGLWSEISAKYLGNMLGFRSERLKVQNNLRGAAALVLAEKLSLNKVENDPYRQTVSFERSLDEALRGRIEYSKDSSTSVKKDLLTIGLIWTDRILDTSLPKE